MEILKVENLNKVYGTGASKVVALDNVSFTVEKGEFVSIVGASGSGKSTLLHLIGGVDRPTSGKVFINDEDIYKLNNDDLAIFRRRQIGLIYQFYNLIPILNVEENITLPCDLDGSEVDKARLSEMLKTLGLENRKTHLPNQLSGGQQQRVSIGRAMINNPAIMLADEPTGNLDSKNTIEVMNIIKSLSRDRLVILVTHERELAKFYSDRIIEIFDGKIVNDYINKDNHELDYRLDNKVYLKDIKMHETIKGKNVNIDYYAIDESKLNLKIVVKNDNIYIESDSFKKIENINNSNIELVDAHYEKINKKVYEEFSFDYNKVKNDKFKSKYSSIYNIFSGTKRGLMKILNYSFIKKLLLVGFFMSSMFIMYSVSSIMDTFNIKEKDFVNYNKNYLLLTKNNMTKSEYDKISNMNNVNYAIPTDGMVTLNFKFGNYLQTSGVMQTINGNLASSSLVDKIISGTKIKNNNEIIIDKLVIDKFLSMSDAKNAGYLTYDSFIKESVYLKDSQEYKIVGISDTSSPSIYASDSELINIIDNFINDDYLMEETTSYKDYKRVNASLTSGRYPVNDYE